jgi:ABC-type polysaccharide/polyol phosphate export permease
MEIVFTKDSIAFLRAIYPEEFRSSAIMGVIVMQSKLYKKYRYSLILLRELVITDFKLRYQGSVLGYLWALLKPLFLFAIL